MSNKRRSTPLSYNARRLVRNDQIYFWQPECNCVDSEKCQEDRCCGSVVMGWVKINDPFCQQYLITDVEDNDEYVLYRQLRNKPCVRDTEPEIDETEQDQESGSDVHRSFVKKQARVTSATQLMPQVDILSLLPNVDNDVELTYAPCENDIIKVMFSCFFAYKLCFLILITLDWHQIFSKYFSHLIFVQSFFFQVGSIASYANDDFESKKVYYDVQKRKACAFMQSISDPDIRSAHPNNSCCHNNIF